MPVALHVITIKLRVAIAGHHHCSKKKSQALIHLIEYAMRLIKAPVSVA